MNEKKEFVALVRQIQSHSVWEIFSDFVLMFAVAISNRVDSGHYEKREAMYMKTISKYTKSEQNIFPKLCTNVIIAMEENPERDYLGEIFMSLELGNKRNGQFFTPYHICVLMAKMQIHDVSKQVQERGYISVSDPCCGAGALLIAFANSVRNAKVNYCNQILFVAQDIDYTAAMMCYIQLSLLGCAGYVKVGNSLTEPITVNDDTSNYWYTPMYYNDVWVYRRLIHKMSKQTEQFDGKSKNAGIIPTAEIAGTNCKQIKKESQTHEMPITKSETFTIDQNGQYCLF